MAFLSTMTFPTEAARAPVLAAAAPVVLAAANDLADGPERASSELAASCSGRRLWADHLPSCAVSIAGSARFAAVALLDGSLQVE